MTLSELAKTAPKCQHLVNGRYCDWLTGKIGRPYPVSPIFCNFSCKRRGPFCGQTPAPDALRDFLVEAWWRSSPIESAAFAKRVLNRFSRPVEVYIPEAWQQISEQLAFLKSLPGFKRLLLTGSVIVKGDVPVKDYDVVLWFDGLKSILDADLAAKLPKTINGVSVDYFYNTSADEVPDFYFASLDPENKILYTSRWFNIKITGVQEGITVLQKKVEFFEDILRERLWRTTPTPEEVEKAKSEWSKVRVTWEGAKNFLFAVASRGVTEERVDSATYQARRHSCFGDADNDPCPMLMKNHTTKKSFCGACGCGETDLAMLDSGDAAAYTKLHYPKLQCPLERTGFSNSKPLDSKPVICDTDGAKQIN